MADESPPIAVLGHSHQHFDFDAGQTPAARVSPGAVVAFDTMDACCGEVRTVEQFLARRKAGRRSNPLTGPVFISGARPGDTLVVEILDVRLNEEGFQLIGPQRGIIKDEIQTWRCHAFRISGKTLLFPNGLRGPVSPVIGAFGNAPRGRPTFHANPLGGNLDAPAAQIGAKLYVPIQVEGALFSLGDVHACQGDGEVVGAPEIGARVTVRLDLLSHAHSDWCMIEDPISWHSICSAESEAEAARLAVFQNARFLARTSGLEFDDALVLLTLIGRLSICRTGIWGNQSPVVSSAFSKQRALEAIDSVMP